MVLEKYARQLRYLHTEKNLLAEVVVGMHTIVIS